MIIKNQSDIPDCGEDFCPGCGDCYSCYGWYEKQPDGTYIWGCCYCDEEAD
jgi:hypothetical protein